ncbi:DUF1499 domain-containing protein [Aliifodinibius salicampi]|uniref:DUF1499 domain-containing protein n=1 Tax=Fodinibius salicampi TaxID=1920655 RepID=A0ABT3PW83_9BACT|nr:DUF1499 domain-containing protein [Fodinibius salicampi]MCW9712119.1 DUF1499 domain-containing protein [Fodinibius salicampi]
MDQEKTSKWALASAGFGIIAIITLLLAGYGYQWDWWGLGTSFTWLLPGSTIVGLIAFSLAIVFGFARRNSPNKKGAGFVALGLILSLAVMGTVGYWYMEAQKYPPIHDITTDIENPPEFRAIVPLRADAPNDTTYGDQEKAQTQREHYPNIETLYLDVGYSVAFDRALAAAQEMPWEEIVTVDKEAGMIEAFDRLPWFGFIDDVVIRVDTAETAERSKIDVRSVSRIGRGDIGVNAHRIQEYLEAVENQ